MAKKVFIGVGHGGTDSGAAANGLREKDLNLAIALVVRDELTRHGVSVQMSRTKDEADPLVDEIKECNAFNPDLALDIHNNAGGGDGAEVFHTVGGGTGKTLAQNILDAIVAIGQNSRGLKTKKNAAGKDYFGFIREIKAPSVIVECAFVDNKSDVQIIATAAKQKVMGTAIAKGVLKTLGITYKAGTVQSPASPAKPPKSTAPATTGVLYKVTGDWCWIRKGAGTNYAKNGKVYKGQVYTIMEVKSGTGSKAGWGRLKSGAGWISLDFCKKK